MEKKYSIQYTPTFMAQFHEILFHIRFELQNDIAAENVMNAIIEAIEKRSISPESYQIFKKYKNGRLKVYRINVKSYSIFYEVEDNIMKVLTIYYFKRNIDELI